MQKTQPSCFKFGFDFFTGPLALVAKPKVRLCGSSTKPSPTNNNSDKEKQQQQRKTTPLTTTEQ
eukprot:m.260806 g.260806  ORF g.260806 m.260806 type:complete len:64 (+) comp26779_c0_seq36:107-298(+)